MEPYCALGCMRPTIQKYPVGKERRLLYGSSYSAAELNFTWEGEYPKWRLIAFEKWEMSSKPVSKETSDTGLWVYSSR
jgi:hypothetical protein